METRSRRLRKKLFGAEIKSMVRYRMFSNFSSEYTFD